MTHNQLTQLSHKLTGKLLFDETIRTLYSTDASAYKEMPLAVAVPETEADIQELIRFANGNKVSLIPRTAGTSLAGQVVGNGIVVDVSQKFTQILEVNANEKWVRVQAGVIRDELNIFLAKHALFFGPETSTANRAMIGGMVGNNASGANSIIYGSTRDNLLELKGYLSDGSYVTFKSLTEEEFRAKLNGNAHSLETKIYQHINQTLSDEAVRNEIEEQFPKASIKRRNTGYAIDLLAQMLPFSPQGKAFNFCNLIAGSEGTLFFITEIKLNCHPLPPKYKGLVCVHFNSIDQALRANLIALKHNPSASELMDDYILSCTKNNTEQAKNRFFLQGEPAALLVVELSRESEEEIKTEAQLIEKEMRAAGLGYHFPLVMGADVKKVWTLRKAGLGLLSNVPGDEKAVPVIEDTAVDVNDLADYIREFNHTLQKYNLTCVHYAHAGSGELHLRPVLNLKTEEGNRMFKTIAQEIAQLVKKYKGSLSGEHGDGRLRGEFIPYMIGEKNYQLLKDLKYTWDPSNLFNPGKIVHTPSMNERLRFMPGIETPDLETVFDFTKTQGYLRAAEFCNGSGDCRKTEITGGTMCPSYMATRNEKNTTRARANILREYLRKPFTKNPFNHKEIYEVLDLCLSCKACKTECPSNVDVTKLKAEFLQHYYDANGVPFRARMIAYFTQLNQLASIVPWFYNFLFGTKVIAKPLKYLSGFAKERSIPLLHSFTLKNWYKKHSQKRNNTHKRKVYLFNDEFTNFNDTEIGITTISLLEKLGYEVEIPQHVESGRTFLSKGLVRKAKEIAIANVKLLKDIVSEETPLLGIEPSAILTFRDEYLELMPKDLQAYAEKLSKATFLLDEFIAMEIDKGNIKAEQFTDQPQEILLHGHCHQKSLASTQATLKMLSLPKNFSVKEIPSGCCGMAGSFGYEKEHYSLSMQVGELVLFPAIRTKNKLTIITAPGTSCRHQIKDGTNEIALHPVEILYRALR